MLFIHTSNQSHKMEQLEHIKENRMPNEKIKILIIDDEPFNIEIIQHFLSDSYTLISAENGESGLQVLEDDHTIEIVLLDVSMPNMSGYEVCKRIRANNSLDDTAIIFVSACGSIDERMEGYKSGGDDYLVKPFEKDELKVKLQLISRYKNDKKQLNNSLQYATNTAMESMTGNSEMGLALRYSDSSFKAASYSELTNNLIDTLHQLNLCVAIRLEHNGAYEWYQTEGEPSPLEKELIELIAAKERIFSFDNRSQFNFGKINLLIKNMPLEDENKYGRYKDLIPFLLDSSNARLKSIDDSKTLADHARLKTVISEVHDLLNHEKAYILEGQTASHDMLDDMVRALEARIPFMGLDDDQENCLINIIEDKIEAAAKASDIKVRSEEIFSKIMTMLNSLL